VYGPIVISLFEVFYMIQIDRNALAQSRIAGGASKASAASAIASNVFPSTDTTTTTTQTSGSTSSLIILNGKTVVNETHTFTA
jgi:hypothetical protein